MRVSFAIACAALVVCGPSSSASTRTPIHFIYSNPNATYAEFQSDRDTCHRQAAKPRWEPLGIAGWHPVDRPSSTKFLNCMAEKGYTLAKNGWDTGVLWTLPYVPNNWHGAGWHVIEPGGLITSGPYPSKSACDDAKPSGSHALSCAWLDHYPAPH